MKKCFLLFVSLFFLTTASAQELQNDSVVVDSVSITMPDSVAASVAPTVSIAEQEEKPMKICGEVFAKTRDRYKIYPTSNLYNFLKLDTCLGYVYRIQWSGEVNKRYETYVNSKRLVTYEDEWVDGRFEIYTTQNIYSFLLLDKIDGRVWHCQWGFESDNNWIKRIN